jgi:hypothetical protein
MSEKERDNYISLVATLVVSVPYFIFIFAKYQGTELVTAADELQFWATAVLVLIPFRIVGEILMYIAAAILHAIVTGKKEMEDKSDERDEIIDLKSIRTSYYLLMFGFLLAIILAAAGHSITTMFVVILISGFISEIIEICAKIFYYFKGV